MIQLVNYELRAISEIIQANDLKIKLRTNGKVVTAKSLRLEQELEYTANDDGVVISLPILNEFDVITVEIA